MDRNTTNALLNMGFTQQEIQAYEYIYVNGGKFSPAALQSYGYDINSAKRLAYMNKIMQGNIQINSENDMITHVKKMTGVSRDMAKQAVYRENLSNGYGAQNYSEVELIKHLKETNGRQRKITIQDLSISKVTTVPRVALVGGIIDAPYNIWNSKNYSGKDALYRVIDVSGSRITIETSRKPRLEWGKAKELPGILEIKGVRSNGNAIVSFDKKYCRLCNRFVIVASLKNPEFHLGKYDMICFEGTRVYIFAINMGIKEKIKYNNGNQRIYAYGIMTQDIKGKLDSVAKAMYQELHGVAVNYIEPNSDYSVVSKTQVDEQMEDEDIQM